ncbi:septal ring lytic transglycosylase RlpA family protein [Methylomonas paludis]|nr:septal ring lytic transglycosylase RlpA family protein [Methylomonas paludis]
MLSVTLALFCTTGLTKAAEFNAFDDQIGIASYFNDKFHGHRTASGERYDKHDLTAAHATLPFGTVIHVVNLKNNQSVDVRINSRAHRSNRRLLDLSKQAAKELGFLQAGIAKVKITVVSLGEA